MVHRPRPLPLPDLVARRHPEIDDPDQAIRAGLVTVNGLPVTNPAARFRQDVTIGLVGQLPLRGEAKLEAALVAFNVNVEMRTCIDVGASTGGFTRVLLRHGAARVYAVDAGHGQLLGSLRQDPRVVNLEATNVADLGADVVRDLIDCVTIDVSYLALSAAVAQLEAVRLSAGADLIGLVKPMFELGLAFAPTGGTEVEQAGRLACERIALLGWDVRGAIASPVTGARGAAEMLLHARRI